jgi:hypothetical protein
MGFFLKPGYAADLAAAVNSFLLVHKLMLRKVQGSRFKVQS